MCGRFGLGNPERLDGFMHRYAFPEVGMAAPRFNITPSADIPIVLTIDGALVSALARWGLVPSWAKDESVGTRLVQARGETVHEKPSYRSALKSRRGLLPLDLFYEWQAVAGQKVQQPWCIRMRDDEPFAMAALWETWLSPHSTDGAFLLSCCVLTTPSNHSLKHIHDRMPLVLYPDDYEQWLDPKTKPDVVQEFIRPYPLDGLHGYKVSTWVNNPSHNDARCVEPLRDDSVNSEVHSADTTTTKLTEKIAPAPEIETAARKSPQLDAFN